MRPVLRTPSDRSSACSVRLARHMRALGPDSAGVFLRRGQVLQIMEVEVPAPRSPGKLSLRVAGGPLEGCVLTGHERHDWEVVPTGTPEKLEYELLDTEAIQVIGVGEAGAVVVGTLRARDRGALIEHVPMHVVLPNRGSGAHTDPDKARAAARLVVPPLLEELGRPALVVVAASLDEPSGAGGAPMVVEALRREGIDVVAVVHGQATSSTGTLALRCLGEHAGSVILAPPSADMFTGLVQTARVLLGATECGMVGLELAEVKTLLAQQGRLANVGFGSASGPDCGAEAVRRAVRTLPAGALSLARAFFMRIAGGSDLRIAHISTAIEELQQDVHHERVIFQGVVDEWHDTGVEIGLIALGAEQPEP